MNKSELIEHIAADADISKAAATRALESTIESITAALKKGDSVSLVGFGTFEVSKRAAETLPQALPLQSRLLLCQSFVLVKR